MSANYYLNEPHTGLHLGKSAHNRYSVRAHPDLGLTSIEAYIPFLIDKKIVSEAGTVLSFREWISMIVRADDAKDEFEKYFKNNPLGSDSWYDEEWGLIFTPSDFF